jgi:formylglycine-generating enzyme required for sulfatase activity
MNFKIHILSALLLCLPFFGIAQNCYVLARQKGDELFKNGQYQEAIKLWESAKKCSDNPKNGELEGKISRANAALKPKTTPPKPKPQARSRQEETPSKPVERPFEKPIYNPPPTVSPNKQTADVAVPKDLTFGLQMLKIEGGTFNMGSNDPNHYADERPVHKVILRGYAMSKYEVTQRQWRDVMGGFPEDFTNLNCDNCPMNFISWGDIQGFLTKLNEKTGKKYRLPTEAEWEYAVKGGKVNSSFLYSGGNDLQKVAWFADNSEGKIKQVGLKKANDLGIYDLTGNVQEWCADFYSDSFYKLSGMDNPQNTKATDTRVVRGSAWTDSSEDSRLTLRTSENPLTKSEKIGFRLVLDF